MSKGTGSYTSDGHFGEIVENPHSGLRFMVIARHKANPDAWEGRLAVVVRRRYADKEGDEFFDLGAVHHISVSGWNRVDD